MNIRVMHVGLGPIGALVAQQLVTRRGFQLVGAVDIDPAKIGRDIGEVAELGRKLRVKVTPDIGKTIRATKPDIVVLCTSSSLKAVLPQIEEVLARRVPIVTTTEQVAYPARSNRRLAKRLDESLPPDVSANTTLVSLLRGLIAPDPADRFANAEDADLRPNGAAEIHRQLIRSNLASEYENEIRLWLEELE